MCCRETDKLYLRLRRHVLSSTLGARKKSISELISPVAEPQMHSRLLLRPLALPAYEADAYGGSVGEMQHFSPPCFKRSEIHPAAMPRRLPPCLQCIDKEVFSTATSARNIRVVAAATGCAHVLKWEVARHPDGTGVGVIDCEALRAGRLAGPVILELNQYFTALAPPPFFFFAHLPLRSTISLSSPPSRISHNWPWSGVVTR